jgi:hypothetical protein
MSAETPAKFRALIIPDTRASLLSSESTFTQADPVVGTPEKVSGQTSLALSASGTVAVSEDVVLQAASSGGRSGAGFLWKNTGDAKHRGYNGPAMVQSWQSLAYFDGSGTPHSVSDPQAVTMPNGSVVVAFERRTGVGRETVTRKYTPSTDTWSSATIVYQTSSTTGAGSIMRPTMVVLPSRRLLLFHWVFASGIYNIRCHYSVDSGANWSLASRGVLDAPIVLATHTVGRLRAVYSGIGIAMAAELDGNKIRQFYSTDFGASFTTLSDQLGSSYCHDLVDLAGSLGMITLPTGANASAKLRIVGSITEPVKDVEVIAIPTGDFGHTGADEQDIASWVDDDGSLFVVGRLVNASDKVIGLWSPAPYTSWSYLGESATGISGTKTGLIIDTTTANVYPRYLTATSSGGRAMLFHSWSASGSAFDDSLAVACLGGWSSVPLGSVDDSLDADQTGGYTACYFPYDLPNTGSVWTAAGAGTSALASGSLQLLLNGSSNYRYYTKAPSGAFANGLLFAATIAVTAGGATTSARAGIQLMVADGSSEIHLELRFSTSAFLVYDKNAGGTGAPLGLAPSIDTTGGVDILVYMKDTTARVYYKVANSSEDQEYIAGPSGAITKKTSGAAAANRVRFGRIVANAATSMTITSVQYTMGTYVTEPADTTADQRGRAFPSYVAGGISADQTGVAYAGDIHKIPIEYDYALTRALPLASPPSPRIAWRSTDETQATIAVLFSNAKANVTDLGGDMLGVHLEGINWASGKVQGYNGSAWVDLATIDTAADYDGLTFTRLGNAITPGSSNANFWSDRHEWSGSRFKFTPPSGGKCRVINTNASGDWYNANTGKHTTLFLDGVANTDPASGSTGEIWPSRATILIPLVGVNYSAIRLLITANQGTSEGYYEIGQMVVGPVLMLADSYSWGRSIETQTGTTLQTAPDRIDRASVNAPARRIIEFGWTDGVDQTNVGDIVATGSATSGALPLAAHGETIHAIEGAIRASDGPRRALVYLPNVSRLAGDSIATITRREATVLVRAVSDIRRDTVVGDELTTELARLSSVVLEEIV